MIIDFKKNPDLQLSDKKYDVCIIGGGIAGITLATKLSNSLSIALIEAGDFTYSEESQSLYKGTTTGTPYFDLASTRLRYMGGSSNHWGGWCLPLDEKDYRKKEYLPHSGWPISKANLDPYLNDALEAADVPSPESIGRSILDDVITEEVGFEKFQMLYSPFTRFGVKYRSRLEGQSNITCVLNASVTDIKMHDNLEDAKSVLCTGYDGRSLEINASTFVLCTGGIENPRLLLNFNKQIKSGIGNQNDLVGRFFTEHPHFTVANYILEDNLEVPKYSFFSPSLKYMEEEKILNFGLRVFRISKVGEELSFKDKLREMLCDVSFTRRAAETLKGKEMTCDVEGKIRIASEQALNENSRITLNDEIDSLGMKKANLHWQLSEVDRKTLLSPTLKIAALFATKNIGRVKLVDWLLNLNDYPIPGEDEVAGHHHMCTTRMSDSPATGVVDQNLKIFGTNNIYVSGSSVFGTGGHANPTLTIIQLTLRLANHMNDILAKTRSA